MSNVDDARNRAAATYNAAADRYDDPANSFWNRFGEQTVERLNLRAGATVLDVCCGSGASALAAAARVGPTGSVVGVDLAERMLELARAKAAARGLRNVEFRVGDLLNPGVAAGSADAVVCVFGLFFVPDMVAAARTLWAAVRPGGTLAITTWGPRFFEPMSGAFWEAVRQVRPELHKRFNPWDSLCEPSALDALLREAGIARADIVPCAERHPLGSPDAWWAAVMGSGYRGTIEQLDPAQREQVRDANAQFLRASGLDSVEANVIFATAVKP